mmetsp:Transcript_73456/g.163123  ORF Transcript_73456/g.163123 Transcript_73456/m.163123 type:complete len:83 (-) Transcript_73456:266-514(-)
MSGNWLMRLRRTSELPELANGHAARTKSTVKSRKLNRRKVIRAHALHATVHEGRHAPRRFLGDMSSLGTPYYHIRMYGGSAH